MAETPDQEPDTPSRATHERQAMTGDDTEASDDQPTVSATPPDQFLVPGPTPESNANLGRWGCSWLMFSIALMLMMAAMSWVCLVLARWTDLA
jgi:hypothetical protein